MRRLALCFVLVGMNAAAAFAQERAPIEVGLGISSFGAGTSYEGVRPPNGQGPDVRVTFPVSRRFSIEEMVTFSGSTERYAGYYDERRDGVIFATQVKQRIEMWTRGGFHPFLVYGGAVSSERQRTDFAPVRLPGGTVRTFPTQTSERQWIYGVFGAGVQQQIGKHVSVRAEVTTLTFLASNVKASVGVSIPLGSYK